MKKIYAQPEVEIKLFVVEDVITESDSVEPTSENDLPELPI